MTHHVFIETKVNCYQVNQCLYTSWSRHFPGHTPPAKVWKGLPPAFLEYLESDSITLPPPQYIEAQPNSDNEYSDWEDEPQAENPCAAFADLDKEISDTVRQWRKVMVKLNWSAPKDAKWILINNSLQCVSAADVYLLLNALDHVAHDLDGHIYDECDDKADGQHMEPELVIKKWIDINPALEFRLFVRDGCLVGASQRDPNHYQFLAGIKDKLESTISDFYASVLRTSSFPLGSYIMDVYIASPYTKVTIIDVNPFTRKWDGLLYTWHELLELSPDEFELRILTETNMGALARKEHSENQVPIEIVGALMDTEAMIALAKTMNETQLSE